MNEPTNSLTDCGNDNTVVYFDTLNGVIYTVLTAQEVQELLVNHGLYPVCSETDAKYCKWSDGVGGETDCTGGNCKVISTQNPDYTTSICQGCYINGQLHHAGACRLRP